MRFSSGPKTRLARGARNARSSTWIDPDVRVVLASGYSELDVVSRFVGKGLNGSLQKPYTLAKLREMLSSLGLPGEIRSR